MEIDLAEKFCQLESIFVHKIVFFAEDLLPNQEVLALLNELQVALSATGHSQLYRLQAFLQSQREPSELVEALASYKTEIFQA